MKRNSKGGIERRVKNETKSKVIKNKQMNLGQNGENTNFRHKRNKKNN